VRCECCGEFFSGEVDADGSIRPLGIPGECCEGYGFQQVEDEVTDEFARKS
jgi:hypothetical protein